jgi:hypothetical protein
VSPAGFSDENQREAKRLILQPEVTKTLIKGVIPLAVLSLFLNIAPNLANYFLFVGVWFAVLGLYMLVKRNSKFMIGEDNIMVKRVLGKSKTISYLDILDLSVSQGMLARKFKCGSVYLILKGGKGGVNLMGGGSAERLDDVPNPNYIYDLIASRLGPYSSPPS